MAEMKARHAFGNLVDVQKALDSGKINEYDILFLDGDTSPKIGWIDAKGNFRLVENEADFSELEEMIAKKADAEKVETLEEQVATKADAAEVETALASKADAEKVEAIETELASKANSSDVETLETELTTKVTEEEVKTMIKESEDSLVEIVEF